ncbi:MAG: hypothetical protein WBV22_07270 [Anaerolineaceae bacterium]
MTLNNPFSLENLWDEILSREATRIVAAFNKLDQDEQDSIVKHLERMTNEEGWHVDQVRSAQVALEAIRRMASDD